MKNNKRLLMIIPFILAIVLAGIVFTLCDASILMWLILFVVVNISAARLGTWAARG